VGADAGPVELAGGEVRGLVAEDFVEKDVSVRGLGDVGGDADEAAVRVAAAEGAGEAGRELDAGPGGEVGGVPAMEPVVHVGFGLWGEEELAWHGEG
jgi:hypothetical protein